MHAGWAIIGVFEVNQRRGRSEVGGLNGEKEGCGVQKKKG